MMKPRNEPMGIEGRTLKNLEFIKGVFDQSPADGRVHVVTQVVNSLLGLVILPHEKGYVLHNDKNMLEKLYADDWPRWNITLPKPGEPEQLGKLTWHLRNAAAHGLYTFSSDSPELSEVTITVEDRPKRNAQINWRAEIRADELYKFCQCLCEYIKGKQNG